MKHRIVVLVEGGNVQGVFMSGSLPVGIKAEVVDMDNLKAEGLMRTEREEAEANALRGLHQIY